MRLRRCDYRALIACAVLAGGMTTIGALAKGYSDGFDAGWEACQKSREAAVQMAVETAFRQEPEAEPVFLSCCISTPTVISKTETTTEPAEPEEPEAETVGENAEVLPVADEARRFQGSGAIIGAVSDDNCSAATRASAGTYTEDDIFCLAAVIYQEAGGDECADETRYMVADVVLNRVADDRFPDSVRGVLEDAPGGCLQYGRFAITGVCFPERAELESEKNAVRRAWYIAREIAAGEHSDLYGNGYIWQAEFGQGTDQIWADGICFGKG